MCQIAIDKLRYQTINLPTWGENLDSTLSYPFVTPPLGYTRYVMAFQFENVHLFLHL